MSSTVIEKAQSMSSVHLKLLTTKLLKQGGEPSNEYGIKQGYATWPKKGVEEKGVREWH